LTQPHCQWTAGQSKPTLCTAQLHPTLSPPPHTHTHCVRTNRTTYRKQHPPNGAPALFLLGCHVPTLLHVNCLLVVVAVSADRVGVHRGATVCDSGWGVGVGPGRPLGWVGASWCTWKRINQQRKPVITILNLLTLSTKRETPIENYIKDWAAQFLKRGRVAGGRHVLPGPGFCRPPLSPLGSPSRWACLHCGTACWWLPPIT
jgi:hypothetical protein